MHTWPDIAAAIKETLGSIPDLELYDLVPGNPISPCGILEPTSCSWVTTMGKGTVRYDATLTVLVSLADPADAQERIHALLAHSGDHSIPELLMAGRTLNLRDSTGETTTDCHATGWSEFGPVEVNEATYLRAEIPLVIHTKGNAT